ncbi:MAG: hypothetical protein AB7I38_14730 [Dehalococcoidia bacterium]
MASNANGPVDVFGAALARSLDDPALVEKLHRWIIERSGDSSEPENRESTAPPKWEYRTFKRDITSPGVVMSQDEWNRGGPGVLAADISLEVMSLVASLRSDGWELDGEIDAAQMIRDRLVDVSIEHAGVFRKKVYVTLRSITITCRRHTD